jgi:hypothetical protein
MLNDTAEMHWGYGVFEEAAGKLLKIAENKENLRGLNRDFFSTKSTVSSRPYNIAFILLSLAFLANLIHWANGVPTPTTLAALLSAFMVKPLGLCPFHFSPWSTTDKNKCKK